jgi:hypothetical protein
LGDVDVVCIDPAKVAECWSDVSYNIVSALEHGDGLTDFATVERAVLSGAALLWLIRSDHEEILAALVTSLSVANGKKFCTIVACGGRNLDSWLMLIDRIEKYATNENCKSVVIYGRKGWARVLPAYVPVATVLERKL